MEPIRSVYETPRICGFCRAEYIPKRPSRDRPGTWSEFCSRTCQRYSLGRQSRQENAAHRVTREHQSDEREVSPRRERARGPRQDRPPRAPRLSQPRAIRLIAGRSPFALATIEHRIARGWSQSVFAKKMGVSGNTVRNWELDKTAITVDLLVKMADIFGISMDRLYRGPGPSRSVG